MHDFDSDRRSLMPQRDIDRRQVLTVSLVSQPQGPLLRPTPTNVA